MRKMTKSTVKAISGSVRVVVNGGEYWLEPKDIKIGDKTLLEIKGEVETTQEQLDAVNKDLGVKIGELKAETTTLKEEVVKLYRIADGLKEALIKEVAKKVSVVL